MSNAIKTVQAALFDMQDVSYKEFHAKLIPTVNPDAVIGVRTPRLRKFAKEFAKTPEAEEFMRHLPHQYYEENNLHGFILETIRDYDTAMRALEVFLPYIDNWATCDLISPKVFGKQLPALFAKSKEWLQSDRVYTVRFGIGMLMRFYLGDAFTPEILELVAAVQSDEYYVNMMVAWFFATALAKQYEAAAPYLENRRLQKWTHNKAIQKAVESYRITDETKAYLRTLKRKNAD